MRFQAQPAIAVGIDWSNPIANGLVLATNAAATPGVLINFADGTQATPLNTTYGTGQYAYRDYTNGAGRAGDEFTTRYNGTTAVTLAVLCFDSQTANASAVISGSGTGSGSVAGDVNFKPNSANVRGLYFPTGSSVIVNGSTRATWAKKWVLLSLTADGTNLKLYENGANTASTTCALSASASTNAFHVGSDTSDGQVQDYYIALCAFWHRALSASEIQALAGNPWQLFARPRQYYTVIAATSPPTSGRGGMMLMGVG